MAKARKGKIESTRQEQFWGRELEYVMTRGMFEALTENCKGDKNQYALDCINDTFGLLGHVTSITLEGV